MKNIKIKKTNFVIVILFTILLNSLTFAGSGFGISPDTIVNTLDPSPSNVFVLINGGAVTTLFANVTITNLTYGATWVDVADNPLFSPCVTNPYASSFGYTLPTEGTNVLYFRYRDVLDGYYITNQWINLVPEPGILWIFGLLVPLLRGLAIGRGM